MTFCSDNARKGFGVWSLRKRGNTECGVVGGRRVLFVAILSDTEDCRNFLGTWTRVGNFQFLMIVRNSVWWHVYEKGNRFPLRYGDTQKGKSDYRKKNQGGTLLTVSSPHKNPNSSRMFSRSRLWNQLKTPKCFLSLWPLRFRRQFTSNSPY